jgi:hypothetical protein
MGDNLTVDVKHCENDRVSGSQLHPTAANWDSDHHSQRTFVTQLCRLSVTCQPKTSHDLQPISLPEAENPILPRWPRALASRLLVTPSSACEDSSLRTHGAYWATLVVCKLFSYSDWRTQSFSITTTSAIVSILLPSMLVIEEMLTGTPMARVSPTQRYRTTLVAWRTSNNEYLKGEET